MTTSPCFRPGHTLQLVLARRRAAGRESELVLNPEYRELPYLTFVVVVVDVVVVDVVVEVVVEVVLVVVDVVDQLELVVVLQTYGVD